MYYRLSINICIYDYIHVIINSKHKLKAVLFFHEIISFELIV